MISLLNDAINSIDEFYDCSFKLPPGNCNPYLLSFIDKMETINQLVASHKAAKLTDYLKLTLVAMQDGDDILVRDYLIYEIKPLLQKMIKKTNKKDNKKAASKTHRKTRF